jgi:hypothetical protein
MRETSNVYLCVIFKTPIDKDDSTHHSLISQFCLATLLSDKEQGQGTDRNAHIFIDNATLSKQTAQAVHNKLICACQYPTSSILIDRQDGFGSSTFF